jgi:hypothetical protein
MKRTESTNSVADIAIAIALETRYNTLQPKLKRWANCNAG